MRFRKEDEIIEICDNCFQEKTIRKAISTIRFLIEVCSDCEINFNENPNSIKRLRWYMILYKYQNKGYERF